MHRAGVREQMPHPSPLHGQTSADTCSTARPPIFQMPPLKRSRQSELATTPLLHLLEKAGQKSDMFAARP
eukprot:15313214-Alexandrium_andersonii.AAC.1